MANIKLDVSYTLGRIKPMHGGGQPPVLSNAKDTYFHYLTEAGIPYSRLHDVGGAFGCGKYVDIHNIFRNFDADENAPESYDFAFTDVLLEQLHKAGVEPYFRLGETIENAAWVKTYYLDPPKDFDKWARICEHIVRHYTKGWANGYHYKITYWEIWGEPDAYHKELWRGTAEEFYRLYHVTATHLKKHHPEIKVGAYGATGFSCCLPDISESERKKYQVHIDWFHGFLDYIKERNTPIDFFSWHCYRPVKDIVPMGEWVHTQLVKWGYGHVESHLNEWDPYCQEFGTGHHAAEMAAVMIAMQHSSVDVCCIYDMRTANAPYCPLFSPITHKPIHGYYSMVAFNTLYQLGTQIAASCDTDRLFTLAASNGTEHAVMIANITGETQQLQIQGADLSNARYHVIDNERLLSWSPAVSEIENNQVLLIQW